MRHGCSVDLGANITIVQAMSKCSKVPLSVAPLQVACWPRPCTWNGFEALEILQPVSSWSRTLQPMGLVYETLIPIECKCLASRGLSLYRPISHGRYVRVHATADNHRCKVFVCYLSPCSGSVPFARVAVTCTSIWPSEAAVLLTNASHHYQIQVCRVRP
jgi:hypothetical protein